MAADLHPKDFERIVAAAAVTLAGFDRPPEDDGSGNWLVAVISSVVGSALTVAGIVLQKKAQKKVSSARWVFGDIVITPHWVLGFLFTAVLPIPVQVLAYSLAPMSLTAPLSGISVALNMVLAPALLGERLQPWPDLPATGLILLGSVFTTMFGSHSKTNQVTTDVGSLFREASFLCFFALLVFAVAGCIVYMRVHMADIEAAARLRPTNPNVVEVMLPAAVSAGCGCLVNIALKLVGESVTSHRPFLSCAGWLLLAVLPAILQLNFLNRGLRLYLQTVFFPIYSAMLVLANTFYGLVFFKEYEALLADGFESLGFLFGIALVALGVVMFTRRRSEVEGGLDHQMNEALEATTRSTEMGRRGPPRCIRGSIPFSFSDVSQEDLGAWASIVD